MSPQVSRTSVIHPNTLWLTCRAMCSLAKYAVGALAAHFCYHQQYKDLGHDFENLVFNPYLFRIFEAGKRPGDLKGIQEYLRDRELDRQQRFREEVAIRSEWSTDPQENLITNAGYFFYPTSEEPGHFEKFLADDLAYFFQMIRDMRDTWVQAGEAYIHLWEAFPQRQAEDSVNS